jgi:hypothetical protein
MKEESISRGKKQRINKKLKEMEGPSDEKPVDPKAAKPKEAKKEPSKK